MRWWLLWVALCGFTHADRTTIDANVQTTFTDEVATQATERTLRGKHRQLVANPRPIPNGNGGQFQFIVDEYVGPQGAGYTLNARVRQASCPERPTGEPCVWRSFRHEGAEGYRDAGEGVWTLEPLEP